MRVRELQIQQSKYPIIKLDGLKYLLTISNFDRLKNWAQDRNFDKKFLGLGAVHKLRLQEVGGQKIDFL